MTLGQPTRWAYGVHDCYSSNDIVDKAGGFKATGSLRNDMLALCNQCTVVPHPAIVPKAENESAEVEDASKLAAQSTLFDLATLEMLKVVIPTSLHLQEIRLSGCHLDCEMLGLLRAGLSENSTVHTMYLDWNPLEVPLDATNLNEIATAGDRPEDLDELEKRRERQQIDRALSGFREVLSLRAEQLLGAKPEADEQAGGAPSPTDPPPAVKPTVIDGQLKEMISRVAVAAQPNYPGTAMLEPLEIGAWTLAFQDALMLPARETEQIFSLLDRSPFGPGDGYVPLVRLELALQQLSSAETNTAEQQAEDPLGSAFAAFVNQTSVLEVLSFRCCNIGRLEFDPIGKAMRTHKSLRALNLWGNRICDSTCNLLAEALEAAAPWYSVVYLGLGRNLVTHRGLQRLCAGCVRKVEDRKDGEEVKKEIGKAEKEKEKYTKKPDPPRLDGKGRERYRADWSLDVCEEQVDPGSGQPVWIHVRNAVLKTLNLEENLIDDAAAVRRLQPLGMGDLVLRGCPCAAALADEGGAGATEEEKVSWPGVPGWNLVLR